jgi:hypothetical protein
MTLAMNDLTTNLIGARITGFRPDRDSAWEPVTGTIRALWLRSSLPYVMVLVETGSELIECAACQLRLEEPARFVMLPTGTGSISVEPAT